MTFRTHKLPPEWVFPVSKGDLKRALGETWLSEVTFGLDDEYRNDGKGAPERANLTGRVLLDLMISYRWTSEGQGDLHAWGIVYRVPREEWSDLRREHLVAFLEGKPRAWLDRMRDRPEAQRASGPFLLVESTADGFRTHELTWWRH